MEILSCQSLVDEQQGIDALIFVDGRYKIQATEQVDKKYINTSCSTDVNLHEFIARNCRNKRIGFDPWLHSVSQVKDLESKCSANLIPCENQVDKTWLNRPPRSNKKIREHPVKFSGLKCGLTLCVLVNCDDTCVVLLFRSRIQLP